MYRASCGNLKPMDMTFMNRKLEMKLNIYVKEKKGTSTFLGKHCVVYDGLNGKYGA